MEATSLYKGATALWVLRDLRLTQDATCVDACQCDGCVSFCSIGVLSQLFGHVAYDHRLIRGFCIAIFYTSLSVKQASFLVSAPPLYGAVHHFPF